MHRTDCYWCPAILLPQDTHDWENCFAELMFSQANESLQWAVTDKTVQLQVMTSQTFLQYVACMRLSRYLLFAAHTQLPQVPQSKLFK